MDLRVKRDSGSYVKPTALKENQFPNAVINHNNDKGSGLGKVVANTRVFNNNFIKC